MEKRSQNDLAGARVRWTIATVGVVTAGILATGCVGITLRVPEARGVRDAQWVVEFEANADVSGGDSLEDETVHSSGPTALAVGRTVALLPSNSCRTTKIGAAGESAQAQLVQMNCGVLISTLEVALGRAGYEVVSWQALRRTDDPVSRAREMGVDVLFEFDQYSLGSIDADWSGASTIRVGHTTGFGSIEGEVAVSDEAMSRCVPMAQQMLSSASSGRSALVATLALKAVDLYRSRVLWYLHGTVSDRDEERSRTARAHFTMTTPNVPYMLSDDAYEILRDAYASSGIRGTIPGDAPDPTRQSEAEFRRMVRERSGGGTRTLELNDSKGANIIIYASIPIVTIPIAAPFTILVNRRHRRVQTVIDENVDRIWTESLYSADWSICNEATRIYAPGAAVTRSAPTRSSSRTLVDGQETRDVAREREDAITQRAVDEMIARLVALRASRPTPR